MYFFLAIAHWEGSSALHDTASATESIQLYSFSILITRTLIGHSVCHLKTIRLQVMSIRGQTMFLETDFDELVMFQVPHYTCPKPQMHTGGAILGWGSPGRKFRSHR